MSDTGVPEPLRGRILDPSHEPATGRRARGLLRARAVVVDELAGSLGYATEEGHATTVIVRLPAANRS